MKVVNISSKKFYSLQSLDIPDIVSNTEAKMYEYESKGVRKVIKRLYLDSGQIFASKLYTLEALDHNKEYLPDSFVIPDALVSVNGKIAGFTVPYNDGVNLDIVLKNAHLNIEEQKYYLKKIGEALEQLKNIRKYTSLNNIYINDLQESNILVNLKNRSISFVDLDSCKIGSNVPFPSRYMLSSSLIAKSNASKYVKNDLMYNGEGNYIANAESDLYCYILIIMNYLLGTDVSRMSKVEFYTYLNYLSYIGIDKNLLDCFDRILRFEWNKNPYNYIDSISYQQLARSREQVYKLYLKKN